MLSRFRKNSSRGIGGGVWLVSDALNGALGLILVLLIVHLDPWRQRRGSGLLRSGGNAAVDGGAAAAAAAFGGAQVVLPPAPVPAARSLCAFRDRSRIMGTALPHAPAYGAPTKLHCCDRCRAARGCVAWVWHADPRGAAREAYGRCELLGAVLRTLASRGHHSGWASAAAAAAGSQARFDLRILSARYGSARRGGAGRSIDVAPVLRRAIDAKGWLEITADENLNVLFGGDPASGDPKRLTLRYSINGRVVEEVVDELSNFPDRDVIVKPEVDAKTALAGLRRYRFAPPPCSAAARGDANAQAMALVRVWGGGDGGGDGGGGGGGGAAATRPPRIGCFVYSTVNSVANMGAINATWARRCDSFAFLTDQHVPTLPTVVLAHRGAEAYQNMWQKVRAIWKWVWATHGAAHEWFVLGGDDMYYVVENLRQLVTQTAALRERDAAGKPLFLGRRFAGGAGTGTFNAGGPGYVLNRAALRALVGALEEEACGPRLKTSAEDVQVAKCLKLRGVLPWDTRDSAGRERFFPFQPKSHVRYKYGADRAAMDWYGRYTSTYGKPEGLAQFSPSAVSFHYLPPEPMRQLDHWLRHCPKDGAA